MPGVSRADRGRRGAGEGGAPASLGGRQEGRPGPQKHCAQPPCGALSPGRRGRTLSEGGRPQLRACPPARPLAERRHPGFPLCWLRVAVAARARRHSNSHCLRPGHTQSPGRLTDGQGGGPYRGRKSLEGRLQTVVSKSPLGQECPPLGSQNARSLAGGEGSAHRAGLPRASGQESKRKPLTALAGGPGVCSTVTPRGPAHRRRSLCPRSPPGGGGEGRGSRRRGRRAGALSSVAEPPEPLTQTEGTCQGSLHPRTSWDWVLGPGVPY